MRFFLLFSLLALIKAQTIAFGTDAPQPTAVKTIAFGDPAQTTPVKTIAFGDPSIPATRTFAFGDPAQPTVIGVDDVPSATAVLPNLQTTGIAFGTDLPEPTEAIRPIGTGSDHTFAKSTAFSNEVNGFLLGAILFVGAYFAV